MMWRIRSERWRMRTWPTARSSSMVLAGTPRRNPNRRVQGMGILKPIHVGILKPQIQIQTHPYPVMECNFRLKKILWWRTKKKKKKKKERTAELKQKKAYNKEKKFHNEIEEKRWSEGWAMFMADGYGEKRVAWEEKRKRKKEKRKEKRWSKGWDKT